MITSSMDTISTANNAKVMEVVDTGRRRFSMANCSDGDAWRDRALLERLTQRWRTRVYCGAGSVSSSDSHLLPGEQDVRQPKVCQSIFAGYFCLTTIHQSVSGREHSRGGAPVFGMVFAKSL